jgi:hypothetical protein
LLGGGVETVNGLEDDLCCDVRMLKKKVAIKTIPTGAGGAGGTGGMVQASFCYKISTLYLVSFC